MGTIIILDLKYTVFAKVIDGWDTLDALERLPVNPKNFKPVKGIFSFILNYSLTKTNILNCDPLHCTAGFHFFTAGKHNRIIRNKHLKT